MVEQTLRVKQTFHIQYAFYAFVRGRSGVFDRLRARDCQECVQNRARVSLCALVRAKQYATGEIVSWDFQRNETNRSRGSFVDFDAVGGKVRGFGGKSRKTLARVAHTTSQVHLLNILDLTFSLKLNLLLCMFKCKWQRWFDSAFQFVHKPSQSDIWRFLCSRNDRSSKRHKQMSHWRGNL